MVEDMQFFGVEEAAGGDVADKGVIGPAIP
jgi:hypothetical protein